MLRKYLNDPDQIIDGKILQIMMLDIPNKLCLLFLPVKYFFFHHFIPFCLPVNIFSIWMYYHLHTKARHMISIRFLEYFDKFKHKLNFEPQQCTGIWLMIINLKINIHAWYLWLSIVNVILYLCFSFVS